jgi:hypothetical protein
MIKRMNKAKKQSIYNIFIAIICFLLALLLIAPSTVISAYAAAGTSASTTVTIDSSQYGQLETEVRKFVDETDTIIPIYKVENSDGSTTNWSAIDKFSKITNGTKQDIDEILVNNNAYDKAPVTVSVVVDDANNNGIIDRVDITPNYPFNDIIEKDTDQGIINSIVTENGTKANIDKIPQNVSIVGGTIEMTDDEVALVTPDQNEYGNYPYKYNLICYDNDNDSAIDTIVVEPYYTLESNHKILNVIDTKDNVVPIKSITDNNGQEIDDYLNVIVEDYFVENAVIDEDNNIVAGDNERGQQPIYVDITAVDLNNDGLYDKLIINPVYPISGEFDNPNVGIVNVTIVDKNGDIIDNNQIPDNIEVDGGYIDQNGVIIPNETFDSYKIIAEDTDGDGFYDKLTIIGSNDSTISDKNNNWPQTGDTIMHVVIPLVILAIASAVLVFAFAYRRREEK